MDNLTFLVLFYWGLLNISLSVANEVLETRLLWLEVNQRLVPEFVTLLASHWSPHGLEETVRRQL